MVYICISIYSTYTRNWYQGQTKQNDDASCIILHFSWSGTQLISGIDNWSTEEEVVNPFLFFDRYKGGQKDILKKQPGWNKSLSNLSIIYEINFLSLL